MANLREATKKQARPCGHACCKIQSISELELVTDTEGNRTKISIQIIVVCLA